MQRATSITLEDIERIAEEANSTEPNINGACRSFCARLIGHIEFHSPAYAASVAGLLYMPHVIQTDAERAA